MLKHLESSLIDLGNEVDLSFSLDQALNRKAGQLSVKAIRLYLLRYKCHSVMTPVILIGNVQPYLVKFYMYI